MKTLKVRILRTWWEQAIGLLGTKQAESVYLKTRFGIHTFGMKYPIDVLILDDNFRVVEMKEDFQPNRLFFWLPTYSNVLELPPGTIQKDLIVVGSEINIDTR